MTHRPSVSTHPSYGTRVYDFLNFFYYFFFFACILSGEHIFSSHVFDREYRSVHVGTYLRRRVSRAVSNHNGPLTIYQCPETSVTRGRVIPLKFWECRIISRTEDVAVTEGVADE